jgi:hypothetical protein
MTPDLARRMFPYDRGADGSPPRRVRSGAAAPRPHTEWPPRFVTVSDWQGVRSVLASSLEQPSPTARTWAQRMYPKLPSAVK